MAHTTGMAPHETEEERSHLRFRPRTMLLALLPLVLLAGVVALIVATDAGLGERTVPPIESLNVQQIRLPERGLITLSTQPTRDGYAGDQTLFAPPFTTTDDELADMVSRLADAVHSVAQNVEPELSGSPSPTTTGADR